MRLDKFANRGWVGHLIEGLEERRLLSGGFIFVAQQGGQDDAGRGPLKFDQAGDYLDGFDVNAVAPEGMVLSGPDLFVLSGFGLENGGSGSIGEYSSVGAGSTINNSLVTGLNNPTALAISGSDLFVADANGTVSEYTTGGTLVRASLISGLDNPVSLAVSGSHLFILTIGDQETVVVGEYTLGGAVVNASLITGLADSSDGAGLAVSGSDVFVSTFNGIAEYTTSGALVNAALIPQVVTDGIAVADSELYFEFNDAVEIYSTSGVAIGNFELPIIDHDYFDAAVIAVEAAAPAGASPLSLNFEVGGSDVYGDTPYTTVCLEDAQGELVTDVAETVTLGIASGPAGAQVEGTISEPLTDGSAVFSHYILSESGTYTLSASDGVDVGGTSSSFFWTTMYQLEISGQPTLSQNGVNSDESTVKVELLDELGDLVLNSSATITVYIAEGPKGAVLGGTTTLPIGADGTVAFTDLTVNKFGSYDLAADSDAVTAAGAASNDAEFTFTADPMTVVSLVGSGSTFNIGQALELSATVQAKTAGQATPTGTVTFENGIGNVLGTLTLDANGVATLSATFIQGGAHTITATYSGDSLYTAGAAGAVTLTDATAVSTSTAVFSKVKIPSTVIQGVKFDSSLPVKISTAAALKGSFTINLYAEPTGDVDGSEIYVTQLMKKLNLKAKGSATVVVPLKVISGTVAAGNYNLVAEVSDPTGAATSAVMANMLQVIKATIQPELNFDGIPRTLFTGELGVIVVSILNEGTVEAKGIAFTFTEAGAEGSVTLVKYAAKGGVVKAGKQVKIRVGYKVAQENVVGSYSPVFDSTVGGVVSTDATYRYAGS